MYVVHIYIYIYIYIHTYIHTHTPLLLDYAPGKRARHRPCHMRGASQGAGQYMLVQLYIYIYIYVYCVCIHTDNI